MGRREAGARHRTSPEPTAERVGARVRLLRRQAEFSFDAFVEETGLGRGYVSELERGLVVPSLTVLARIAEALETSIADLVLADSPREQLFAMARNLPPSELHRLIATAQKLLPRDEAGRFPFRRVPDSARDRFRTALPLYALRPTASFWSDFQEGSNAVWVATPQGVTPRRGQCIVQVFGRALEPHIPDAAWCLFHRPWSSPRSHELGIFVKNGATPESGGYFAVRPYPSSRARVDESEMGRPCARFVRVLM
jgi:transcriptional regulator with XRE-family HTH domain